MFSIDTSHLNWPTTGWGYMPPDPKLLQLFKYIELNQLTDDQYYVLDIGLNAGHSQTYMLEIMRNAILWSVGPSPKYDIINTLTNKYGDRFTGFEMTAEQFAQLKSKLPLFTAAMIDGRHAYDFAVHDINLAVQLKVPYILVDNCELKSVARACESLPEDYMLDQVVFYEHQWKGKTNKLELRLYYNHVFDNIIQQSI